MQKLGGGESRSEHGDRLRAPKHLEAGLRAEANHGVNDHEQRRLAKVQEDVRGEQRQIAVMAFGEEKSKNGQLKEDGCCPRAAEESRQTRHEQECYQIAN